MKKFIIFPNTLPSLLTICRKAKYFIISPQTSMWIRVLNWELEVLHISADNVNYCKVAWSKPSTQALTAVELCLIWHVHKVQWKQLQRPQLLSHPLQLTPGPGIWLPLPIYPLFSFLFSRGLDYRRIKGKSHLFHLSADLSFSIKREYNNNSKI